MVNWEEYIELVDVVINSVFPAYKRDEDMHQLGLIALWQASLSFDKEKASFKVYASAYIKNAIIDEIRKGNRQKRTAECTELNETTENYAQKEPEHAAMDDIIALQQYMETAPKEDKQILQLLGAGYNFKEISEILHWDEKKYNSNRTKIYRLRKMVKKKIDNNHS